MSLFLLIILLILLLFSVSYLYWRIKYGRIRRDSPRVLAYHKIGSFEFSGTWISPGRFSDHIDYLLDSGFSFMDEQEFIDTVEGRRDRSPGELLLTFDDGYVDLLEEAAPVLAGRSVPAVAFIVTSFIGRQNSWELNLPRRRSRHLNWEELRELTEMGISLGSHTATHSDLTRISLEQVREELVRSREILSEGLSREIKSLSYPFGRAGREVRSEAERAGYRVAFSLYPPLRNSVTEPYMLRREAVYVIDTARSLRHKMGWGNRFWMEDLKGRMINGVSVLTPVIKELTGRDR